MPLSEHDSERADAFLTYIEDTNAADERYGVPQRNQRDDGTTVATWFEAGPSCWFEVAVRPQIPQVRVAFLTDDRETSEELEQIIEDSDHTMEEFVGAGLKEAGLRWSDPPVEHYCDDGKYFYFANPLDLEDPGDLDEDATRNKTLRMLEGFLIAFGPAILIDEE